METPTPPKIAIISTSLAAESHSRILCRHASEFAAGKGIDAVLVDLQDYRVLPYGMRGSVGLEEIEVELDGAEAFIIGFPLYNFNMNATLKALLERCGSCFEEKLVGIMCAAGGRSSYLSVMSITQSLMLDFRSWIVPRYVYAVKSDFADGRLKNDKVRLRVEELLETVHRVSWQHKVDLPEA